jgi:hypothetical protein
MQTQTNDHSIIMKEDSKLFMKPLRFSKQVKKESKYQLLRKVNIKKDPNKILIGFIQEKGDTKRNYIFEEILEGLKLIEAFVIILGEKKSHIKDYENIRYISNNKENKKILEKSIDLMILPDSETSEENCIKNGTICILNNNKKNNIKKFNPLEENGDSFILEKENHWLLFASIIKALETYNFNYDWNTLCNNAFERGQNL